MHFFSGTPSRPALTFSVSSSGMPQSLRFLLLTWISGPEMSMGFCVAAIMKGVGSVLMAALETHLSPSTRYEFFTAPHAFLNAQASISCSLMPQSLQPLFHALLNASRKIACALVGKVFLMFSGRSAVLFQGIKGEWSIMVYKGRLGREGKNEGG